MAIPDQSDKSAYLTAFAALVRTDPSRLSDTARQRVHEIISDPGLEGRTAENIISALASEDDTIAAVWDEVQAADPAALRAPDTISPRQPGDGPTHLWYCPVPGCPANDNPEPGLAFGPMRVNECRYHGLELVSSPPKGNP